MRSVPSPLHSFLFFTQVPLIAFHFYDYSYRRLFMSLGVDFTVRSKSLCLVIIVLNLPPYPRCLIFFSFNTIDKLPRKYRRVPFIYLFIFYYEHLYYLSIMRCSLITHLLPLVSQDNLIASLMAVQQ